MQRREFIKAMSGAVTLAVAYPQTALAAPAANYDNLLILIELKGGNDGLNTVVPYADADYYSLRPRIAVPRDQVLQLDAHSGLHSALAPLMPLWQSRELAVAQGVGYPSANLSHFRSIEIWDTASNSAEYLSDGWLTRAFAEAPVPRAYAADGVVVGSNEMGPFSGGNTRALALANSEQFLNQSKLATAAGTSRNPALNHILKVENDVVQAASHLNTLYPLRSEFPAGPFGNGLKAAAQVVASKSGVAAVKVTLNGFDTHGGQQPVQQRLLAEFAAGVLAMRAAMQEIGRWDKTLMMTYCEFGRRPKENQSGGTDHGTSNAHFALGGRVKGGLYGAAPRLAQLDGNGNPQFAIDFRQMYATVLEKWWGIDSSPALNGRFAALDLIKT